MLGRKNFLALASETGVAAQKAQETRPDPGPFRYHFRQSEAMVRVPDPDLGEAIVQNVVPKFSATPGSVDFLGPSMGAHNEEIYGELGFSKERLKELRDAGII